MKRSKFTEEQIIAILHEQDAGAKTPNPLKQRAEIGRLLRNGPKTPVAWPKTTKIPCS